MFSSEKIIPTGYPIPTHQALHGISWFYLYSQKYIHIYRYRYTHVTTIKENETVNLSEIKGKGR